MADAKTFITNKHKNIEKKLAELTEEIYIPKDKKLLNGYISTLTQIEKQVEVLEHIMLLDQQKLLKKMQSEEDKMIRKAKRMSGNA